MGIIMTVPSSTAFQQIKKEIIITWLENGLSIVYRKPESC